MKKTISDFSPLTAEETALLRELETLPLSEMSETPVHGNPFPPEIQCGLREDIPAAFPHPEAILSQVPRTRGWYVVSPDVRHEKLN